MIVATIASSKRAPLRHLNPSKRRRLLAPVAVVPVGSRPLRRMVASVSTWIACRRPSRPRRLQSLRTMPPMVMAKIAPAVARVVRVETRHLPTPEFDLS